MKTLEINKKEMTVSQLASFYKKNMNINWSEAMKIAYSQKEINLDIRDIFTNASSVERCYFTKHKPDNLRGYEYNENGRLFLIKTSENKYYFFMKIKKTDWDHCEMTRTMYLSITENEISENEYNEIRKGRKELAEESYDFPSKYHTYYPLKKANEYEINEYLNLKEYNYTKNY